jgi:hypothetical protein
MSSTDLALAFVEALHDDALGRLAELLAPRLTAIAPAASVDGGGYLAPAAAAQYLGVSRKRIHDLKSMGALEPDGFDGRTPLFTRQTLDAYARGRGERRHGAGPLTP